MIRPAPSFLTNSTVLKQTLASSSSRLPTTRTDSIRQSSIVPAALIASTISIYRPGPSAAYIAAWNKELRPELRLSEAVTIEVVQQTEGFSFAYMKELFLSSMMQWMATRDVPMDKVFLGQAIQLQEQMSVRAKSSAGSR